MICNDVQVRPRHREFGRRVVSKKGAHTGRLTDRGTQKLVGRPSMETLVSRET